MKNTFIKLLGCTPAEALSAVLGLLGLMLCGGECDGFEMQAFLACCGLGLIAIAVVIWLATPHEDEEESNEI